MVRGRVTSCLMLWLANDGLEDVGVEVLEPRFNEGEILYGPLWRSTFMRFTSISPQIYSTDEL